jgi:hypothetical protein
MFGNDFNNKLLCYGLAAVLSAIMFLAAMSYVASLVVSIVHLLFGVPVHHPVSNPPVWIIFR